MKLVMLLAVRDDADVVDAQIAFHLNAGVDFVIASDPTFSDGTTEVIEAYARDGLVRRMAEHGGADDAAWRTRMARIAVDEHGADWVLDSEADEFWMPRAESLKDALVAIPPRYGIVQALVRVFLPRPDDGGFFAERMTVRRTLTDLRDDESMGRLEWALRPIYRATPTIALGGDRDAMLDGRVPLRAWYPVEVLRFPVCSLEQAESRAAGRWGLPEPRSRIEAELFEAYRRGTLAQTWEGLVVDDDELRQGVADGSLVVDDRLHEALSRLERAASARRFALPEHDSGHLELRSPTIVEDVAYAGDCAAVREVDFEPLRDRIAQLEARITELEARFWPRVRRALRRLARPRS